MTRTAIVMAGGRGSRLGTQALDTPKPLLPLAGVPLLEILLRQLEAQGFDEAVVTLHHHAEKLASFLEMRPAGRLAIRVHVEAEPRGPLGALRDIPDLPPTLLVIHGDLLTELAFDAVLEGLDPSSHVARVVVGRVSHPFPYGVVEADETGAIRAFREKPPIIRRTSLGVFAMARRLIDTIPPIGSHGFDELAAGALARGERLLTHPFEGAWFDVGTPERHAAAAEAFGSEPARFLEAGIAR